MGIWGGRPWQREQPCEGPEAADRQESLYLLWGHNVPQDMAGRGVQGGCPGLWGMLHRRVSVPWRPQRSPQAGTFQGFCALHCSCHGGPQLSSHTPLARCSPCPGQRCPGANASKINSSLLVFCLLKDLKHLFFILKVKMYISENLEIIERYKNIKIVWSHKIQNS